MKILSGYSSGNGRSSLVKKNVLASFVLKGIDGLVYLLIVPATLGFLDKYSYGIWLTINSILVWINTFDIGLGGGLRNSLTRSISIQDYEKSRKYISTTYFLLCVLSLVLFSIFCIISFFIDWYSLFNVDPKVIVNLPDVIVYSFLLFCVSFVLKIIGNIYTSLQLQAVNSLFNAIAYVLSLLLILFVRYVMPQGSLMIVAIIFSASPCIVYLFATPYAFYFHHPELRPSIKAIRLRECTHDLLGVGINFFVIQISSLIINSMTNMLISNQFGPEQVTPFNISNRYIAICTLANSIVIAPILSAVTDAQTKGDWRWIENANNKVHKFMILFSIAIFLLLIVSPFVYPIWIGDSVQIPFMMTLLNSIYVFLLIWSSAKSTFLVGLNVLRIQLFMNVFQVIIFFPLTYGLGKHFGIYGLVMGLILSNLPVAITNTIQVSKLIDGKAKGLWAK